MAKTWAIRRKYINEGASVKSIMEEWPAYGQVEQVFADFRRLTNVNLTSTFHANIDKLIAQDSCSSGDIIQNEERNKVIKKVEKLLACKNTHQFDDDCEEEEVLSVSKPMYLAEIRLDSSDFMYYIVIENIIVAETCDLYKAYMYLMAFIWVFNLQYPSTEKYMFEFLQKILLDIDSSNPSSKVLNIVKKL